MNIGMKAEIIYHVYPRKGGRITGVRAIVRRLKNGAKYEPLLERTAEYAEFVKRRRIEKVYTPLASTFFNQKRDQENYDDLHPVQIREVRTSL